MASLVAVVLLLAIVSTLALFTLGYGIRNRQAGEREIATRMAEESAQAGLDQGLAFFRARASEALSTWFHTGAAAAPRAAWRRCEAGETSWPCDVVPAPQRANYFRYVMTTGNGNPSDEVAGLDMRGVFTDSVGAPVQQLIATADGHRVSYKVQALLCLTDIRHPERQCLPADDAMAPENSPVTVWIGPWSIELLSRARVVGTDVGAELRETIAAHGASLPGVIPGSWMAVAHTDLRGTHAAD